MTSITINRARANCIRRLKRDQLLLESEPIPGVSAIPLDDDMTQWHANMSPSNGPYKDTIIHVILKFPDEYPSKPPIVQLCTVIPHPNVFKGWNNGQGEEYPYICLDLLKEHTTTVPYTGWSTAYTVQSIVMQLSAFLFDENVPQDYGNSNRKNIMNGSQVHEAKQHATKFECKKCGHTHGKPYPPIRTHQQKHKHKPTIESTTATTTRTPTHSPWLQLNEPLTQHIFTFLPASSYPFMDRVCRLFRHVLSMYHMRDSSQLQCFYSKVSFHEDTLGFGITAHYYENGPLKEIHTCLDLLSYTAFMIENVRVGVWKEKFTHFLPILINTTHAHRSFRIIERTFCQLSNITIDAFTPALALSYCCTLMNSMVVQLMSTCDRGDVKLYHSEAALQGYVSFHHMLLGFVHRYPKIRTLANDAVNRFKTDTTYRMKRTTPNLGDFIVYLTISDLTWDDVAVELFTEICDRNVKWILQSYPEMSITRGTDRPSICHRLRTTFKTALTSHRLLMFQVIFLKMIRPHGVTLSQTFTSYNHAFGHPPTGMATILQQACTYIMSINYWDEFMDLINIQRLKSDDIYHLLESSIHRSYEKRYHHMPHIRSNGGMSCVCPRHKEKDRIMICSTRAKICITKDSDAYYKAGYEIKHVQPLFLKKLTTTEPAIFPQYHKKMISLSTIRQAASTTKQLVPVVTPAEHVKVTPPEARAKLDADLRAAKEKATAAALAHQQEIQHQQAERERLRQLQQIQLSQEITTKYTTKDRSIKKPRLGMTLVFTEPIKPVATRVHALDEEEFPPLGGSTKRVSVTSDTSMSSSPAASAPSTPLSATPSTPVMSDTTPAEPISHKRMRSSSPNPAHSVAENVLDETQHQHKRQSIGILSSTQSTFLSFMGSSF